MNQSGSTSVQIISKAIGKNLFRHLVITRIVFPLSKLKAIAYLYRYQGVSLEIDTVYRFLDKLNRNTMPLLIKIDRFAAK